MFTCSRCERNISVFVTLKTELESINMSRDKDFFSDSDKAVSQIFTVAEDCHAVVGSFLGGPSSLSDIRLTSSDRPNSRSVKRTRLTSVIKAKFKAVSRVSHHRGSVKAVRTICGILLAFTVCWLPYIIVINLSSCVITTIPYWIHFLTNWLGYCNSALNPVIYCCQKSMRQSVRYLICPSRMT